MKGKEQNKMKEKAEQILIIERRKEKGSELAFAYEYDTGRDLIYYFLRM